ncbi:MAG: CPBP family intramembrane metalloprotease [Streptococcaceae bacterium]|jgi:membrane protease YdiL (CAAX protease family)|nr:CPBP family intramembrane metalloprotease [Streptococcaceae bacterium]
MDKTQMRIDRKKLIIVALIPIVELFLGEVLGKVPNLMIRLPLALLLFFTGMLLAIYLYRDVLKKDWQIFKKRLWLKLLIALALMFATQFLLWLVRQGMMSLNLIPKATESASLSFDLQTTMLSFLPTLLPLMAPFVEEIIFRHALFYQWKNRGALTWVMFGLSAILFGLVHWNNFQGNVMQMIPYMFSGAFFALIYYRSKNIWMNISTHFLFNFSNVALTWLGMILLAFIQQ